MLLLEITTKNISDKEAFKLYSDLITPDNAALEKSKCKSKDKRENTLNVLKNLESVFTVLYLHQKDVPKETRFERSIEEGIKLRRGRLDEIRFYSNLIHYAFCLG